MHIVLRSKRSLSSSRIQSSRWWIPGNRTGCTICRTGLLQYRCWVYNNFLQWLVSSSSRIGARLLRRNTYTLLTGFFLTSLLASTKSFASLVFRVVGLFTSPRVNKPTTRNTRDASDFVHATRGARPLLAR